MNFRPINIHAHRRLPGEAAVVSHRLGIGEPLPAQPFTAGIHPWDAASVDRPACCEELRRLPAVGVGEAGLDKMRGPDLSVQAGVFALQLQIAAERGLPVIIHCVRAYNELLAILKDYSGLPFVVHGFTGSPQLAERIAAAGGCVSFGFGFLASARTAQALRALPSDRLFFETDMHPEPVERIYRAAAETRGVPYEVLVEHVWANYLKIFKAHGMV